jgi:hypothetical protein
VKENHCRVDKPLDDDDDDDVKKEKGLKIFYDVI